MGTNDFGGRVEPLAGEEEVAAATILYRQLEEEVRVWRGESQPRRAKARKKRAGASPAQEVQDEAAVGGNYIVASRDKASQGGGVCAPVV